MSFFKPNKNEEENSQLRQEILELTRLIHKNESTIERIQNELIQSQSSSQELIINQTEDKSQQKSQLEKLEANISSLEEKVNNLKQSPNSVRDDFSSESSSDLEERVHNEINTLRQAQEDAQTRVLTLSQALDLLGNGVDELNQVMKKQLGKKVEDSEKEDSETDWSKHSKNEIIGTIKGEQQELFNKFSEIVTQFNNNFQGELTKTVHALQDSHHRILGELGDHYMPKSIGYELQQLLNDFSNEFKFETQNLRVQIANIKFYQRELLQFRQEIQTMIDHKVNEKFDAISRLLSTVTTKTEEISLHLKNSDIKVTTPSVEESEKRENQPQY